MEFKRGFLCTFQCTAVVFFALVSAQTSSITAPLSLSSSFLLPSTTYKSAETSSPAAQTHTVDVGDGDFKYDPDTIFANVGDIVEFRFFPPNHSVARAEYGKPCIPYELTGTGKVGFWSGFHPVETRSEDPPTFDLLINDTDPVFFYCSAPNSCIGSQMVGVINPNSSVSLATQKADAKTSSYELAPGEAPPMNEADPKSSSPSATPSASSSATPSPAHTKHLSPGAIGGIAIAGVALALLIAAFIFLLGRHTGMLKLLRRSAAPAPTPQPNTQQYNFGFQPPYPPDSYASPPAQMDPFKQSPYGIGADPYPSHLPDRHLSELSSPDLGGQKAFVAYKDGPAYEDVRRQTVSPPLHSPEMHSELDGESIRSPPGYTHTVDVEHR